MAGQPHTMSIVCRAAVAAACALIAAAAAGETNAPPAVTNWTFNVAFGLSVTSGNSDTLNGNLGTAAQRTTPEYEHRIRADAVYGEDNGERSARNAKLGDIVKWRFSSHFVYLDSSILTDSEADIQYRAIVGPGLGQRLFESKTGKVDIEAGASYIRESSAGNVTGDPAFRAAENMELRLNSHARIWQSAEYLPNVTEFGVYLINAEAGIETAVTGTSQLRTLLHYNYDSEPAPERESIDLALRVSFVYRL